MAKLDLTVTISGDAQTLALRKRVTELTESVERFRASYIREGSEHDDTKRRVAQLEAVLRGLQDANGCFGGCDWIHGFGDHDERCNATHAALKGKENA